MDEVHRRFFEAYDKTPKAGNKRRRPDCDVTVSRIFSETVQINDTDQTIIPHLRSEALKGVHIVFSSMFPLDIRPQATDVWKMAEAFGARCSTDLIDDVTHVVAAKVCILSLIQCVFPEFLLARNR